MATSKIPLLAKTFSEVIRDWLSPQQMDEVIFRNTEINTDTDTCASHDFCDANMAMAEAFQKVYNKEVGIQNQKDVDRWNRAWAIAKANNFAI